MPDECMTALLFKIDKRARKASGAGPNPFVNQRKLFELYWQRITVRTDEDLTTVGGKAESRIKCDLRDSRSMTEFTQNPSEVLSQGIKSD